MSQAFHLLKNDLRRLAPFVVLHFAILTWRLAILVREGSVGMGTPSLYLQEFSVFLLLGLLALGDPLFSRRPFWRRLPLNWKALFTAKVLFAALFVLLPRVAAQALCFRFMGIENPLFLIVLVDVLAAQALWTFTILIIASLCRKISDLGFIFTGSLFFLFSFSLALQQFIWSVPNMGPLGRICTFILFSILALLTALLVLHELFRRRSYRVDSQSLSPRILPVLLAITLLILPITSLVSWLERHSSFEPPQHLEFRVTKPQEQRFSYDGRYMLRAKLEPSRLDPTVGLKLVHQEGELITSTGETFPIPEGEFQQPCMSSENIRNSIEGTKGWARCSSSLALFLLETGRVDSWRELEGTLNLQLTLQAFREIRHETPVRRGAALVRQLQSFVLPDIPSTTTKEGSPVEINAHFFHLSRSFNGSSWSSDDFDLSFLDPETGRVWLNVVGGRSGGGGYQDFLLPYSRLAHDRVDLVYRPEDGDPDLEELHLFDVERVYSEPFIKNLTIPFTKNLTLANFSPTAPQGL